MWGRGRGEGRSDASVERGQRFSLQNMFSGQRREGSGSRSMAGARTYRIGQFEKPSFDGVTSRTTFAPLSPDSALALQIRPLLYKYGPVVCSSASVSFFSFFLRTCFAPSQVTQSRSRLSNRCSPVKHRLC